MNEVRDIRPVIDDRELFSGSSWPIGMIPMSWPFDGRQQKNQQFLVVTVVR